MAYISHQLEVHVVREEALAEGEARAKAEGRAEGILALLSVRGVDIDEATRERILSCKDEAILDRWLRNAVTAESPEDLFG
jgi:predicted transposase YdaD